MFEVHGFGDAEQLARRHVADHGLLTLRRGLLDAQVTMQQDKETIGFVALIENGGIFRIADRTCLAQQFVLLAGAQSGEHRQSGDQGTVDSSHRSTFHVSGGPDSTGRLESKRAHAGYVIFCARTLSWRKPEPAGAVAHWPRPG